MQVHSERCEKKRCRGKEVNPHFPDRSYFGVAFRYDPNWLGCRQCRNDPVEIFARHLEEVLVTTTKFRRGN